MTGCKYCHDLDLDKVNDVHRKCDHCPHQACASVEEIGECPCICHFGRTYMTFGGPKIGGVG